MSSYLGSVAVRAGAKDIFAFVTNPDNLPKYVRCISQSDAGIGNVLHIKGQCPHGTFFGVAGFEVDEEHLKMRWDSRANLHYRGSLHIVEREADCSVTIHLEFDPGTDRSANEEFGHLLKEHPMSIQDMLDETLDRIKHLCEQRVAV